MKTTMQSPVRKKYILKPQISKNYKGFRYTISSESQTVLPNPSGWLSYSFRIHILFFENKNCTMCRKSHTLHILTQYIEARKKEIKEHTHTHTINAQTQNPIRPSSLQHPTVDHHHTLRSFTPLSYSMPLANVAATMS